jgi:hypothetical protein
MPISAKSVLQAAGLPENEITQRLTLFDNLPREFLEINSSSCLIFSGKDEVSDICNCIREVALGITRTLHTKEDYLGTPILSPESFTALAAIEKKNTESLQKYWESYERV